MNGKQLKNSILQWAIQGKLVPQDPNDEPASVLLEKIRAEKERLVKEGKLKNKDLEVKPIAEDEIPFEIPKGWEWVRLKDIVNDIADIDHKMPPVSEVGIPYISPLNFKKDGSVDFVNAKKVSKESFEQLSRKCKPERGDIIFPRYGTIGVLRKVETDIDFLVSYSCATIKPHLKSICADFVYYVLLSPLIQNDEIQRYINKTTQPNIGLQSIKQFLIPLPPLAEQHRIVAKIEELMPLVEKYGETQESLEEWNNSLPEKLKKSILQEAIQGKLVPQDPNDEPASVLLERIREEKKRLVEEGKLKKKDLEVKPIEEDEVPFEIPKGWEWFRLSDLANMYTGNSISEAEKKTKYTDVKGMEYIGTKDVSFDHIIDYANGIAIPNKYVPGFKIAPAQSILLCVEGGSAGRKIGVLDRDVCFGNKLCCFDTYIEVSKYLYFYLQSPMFRDVFKSNINGIIGGVSINTLKNLLVPLPPLAEQCRIVSKIEELFGVIKK